MFGSALRTPVRPNSSRSPVCVYTQSGRANPVSVEPVNESICPKAIRPNLPRPGRARSESMRPLSSECVRGWRPGLTVSALSRLS